MGPRNLLGVADPTLSEDLRFRELIHQVTDPRVLEMLDAPHGAGASGDTALTIYAGFDPTAPSLHVGHLLQQCTLRRLQLGGHRPIALAGGSTGMIGDPGGKSEERNLLSADDLEQNLKGVRSQLERFLDFSETAPSATRALLLNNADWLGAMPLVEFLREVGKHFTVNQMVAKESVKARFERPDTGISYTEFSYMLLQAYDFLALFDAHNCTLQIGGSDQWGNITMGVELVRKVRQREVFGLTSPLVLKADGTKFGKTESGTVWLDPSLTSPFRLYQYFVNTEDAVVGRYLRYFTFLSHEEIEALDAETAEHPARRAAARALAREVTALVHGADEVGKAERASAALFGEEIAQLPEATLLDVVEDAPSSVVSRSDYLAGAVTLVDALVSSGLCASKGEARKMVSQGGAYLNNRRQDEPEQVLGSADLLHDRYLVLRRGKRQYHLMRVE
jgi:tyrosyl-tRNA synthetase